MSGDDVKKVMKNTNIKIEWQTGSKKKKKKKSFTQCKDALKKAETDVQRTQENRNELSA